MQDGDPTNEELGLALERLALALSATGLGVWERDIASNRVTWSDTMYRLFDRTQEEFSGDPDEVLGFVHPDDRAEFRQAYLAALQDQQDFFEQEFRIVRPNGEVRWVNRRGRVRRGPHGQARSVLGVALDITERKEREAHIRFLLSEVSHRSKNLLAVVQAIASQTARATHSPVDFADNFSARLKSLAASLDLLVQQEWRGVTVKELVQSQLGHYAGDARVSVQGPNVMLTPLAAQYLGMAVHELSTNAAKYGSLSGPAGSVTIGWRVAGTPDGRRFHMSWREDGGPAVEPPDRTGFGSVVIERMAAEALHGHVTLDYPREGVRWSLDADAAVTLKDASGVTQAIGAGSEAR